MKKLLHFLKLTRRKFKILIFFIILRLFLWWLFSTQIFNLGGTLHYYLKDGQSLVLNINKDAKSDLQIYNGTKAVDKYNIKSAKLSFGTDYFGGQFLSDEDGTYYYLNDNKVKINDFLTNFFYVPQGALYYDYENNYLVYNDAKISTTGPVSNAFMYENNIFFTTIASPSTYYTYNLDTLQTTAYQTNFDITKFFTYKDKIYLFSSSKLYELIDNTPTELNLADPYLLEGTISNLTLFDDFASFTIQTKDKIEIYKLVDNSIKKIAEFPNSPGNVVEVYEQFYTQVVDRTLYFYDVNKEELHKYVGSGLYFEYNSYVLDTNNSSVDKAFYEEPYQ